MPDWPRIVGHIYAPVNKDWQCYFIHWILSEQWTRRLTNCPTLHKYLRLKILPWRLQCTYRVIQSPTTSQLSSTASVALLAKLLPSPKWMVSSQAFCIRRGRGKSEQEQRTLTWFVLESVCKHAQYVLYACVYTIFYNLNILLLCCSLRLRNPTLLFHFIVSDTSQQLFEVASCSTLQQDLCSSQGLILSVIFVN